jgi:hypothetical protein
MSASALCLLVVAVGANGCSSDDRPPAAGSSSGEPIDASFDRVVPGDGGGDTDATPAGDGGSALPLGDLATVDEPDVPCVTSSGTKTQLFDKGDSGGGGPAVTHFYMLGSRRLAAGPNLQGFITFDATGTTPALVEQSLGSTSTLFTSEGTTIGGVGVSNGKVEYQRFDGQGAPSGGLVALANSIADGPAEGWGASGDGGTLAVWLSGTTLFGAGVTAAGAAAGPPFTIDTGIASAHVAITYANGKYAIAYAFAAGTSAAAKFVYASLTGTTGAPVSLASAEAIEPVAIAPTSAGFIMVIDAGGDEHVYIVPLDTTGKVSGTAHRLLGGDLPWGLAAHANDAALVVLTNDTKVGTSEGPRAPQFRPLDITGKPTGPWVCLDGRISAGQNQDMAILAETDGSYSVVYKSVTDTTMLVRLNKLGTAAP